MEIKVTYKSLDGYSKTRKFKTLKFARKFAVEWVGEKPDIGSFYAVSSDGIGRITVKGISIDELFNKPIDRMRAKMKEALDKKITIPNEKVKVDAVVVTEGPLYEKWGEDSQIVCYDLWVEAQAGSKLYVHRHTFKGMGENPDGFPCPNFNAKPDAHRLADRVREAGYINLEHWKSAGSVPSARDTQDDQEDLNSFHIR